MVKKLHVTSYLVHKNHFSPANVSNQGSLMNEISDVDLDLGLMVFQTWFRCENPVILYIHTLLLFQTCVTFIFLWNSKVYGKKILRLFFPKDLHLYSTQE